MKLQTLLEFVLESNDLESIKKYANFLSQKPQKWMFVPCDDEGNVLEEPKAEDYFPTDKPIDQFTEEDKIGFSNYYSPMMIFEQAKDRVIFDGFRMPYNNCFESKKIYFSLLDFGNLEQLINEHSDFLTLKKPIKNETITNHSSL